MTANGTFIFICPACGYKARLPDQLSGRTIKCPGCQSPQVATAPVNLERKTASIIRVAATPVPFTLPPEQADALAGIPSATPVLVPTASFSQTAPSAFPSPLPGAIQITTDRVARMKTPPPGEAPPVAHAAPAAKTAPVAKAAIGATVDFTCMSCNARLRLPSHYAGKSILCPKCSTPQKVIVTAQAQPMDTTRSLALKDDAATAAPKIGTGTGIRVRVTPLPSTYPTPLPQAIAAAVPEATPIAVPVVAAAPAIAAAPIAAPPEPTADAPVKPHPSKGKLSTVASARAPVSSVAPVSPPAKSPSRMLAIAGALVALAIVLGAGLAYYVVALGETRVRLAAAEKSTTQAKEREQEDAQKLKDLERRLVELEVALKVATETAQAAKAAALEPKPELKPEPKPELKDDPKTEPKVQPKAQPKSELKTDPKTDPKAEPKAEAKPGEPVPEAANEVLFPPQE